jgi:hypothetical protein
MQVRIFRASAVHKGRLIVRPIEETELSMAFAAFLDHTGDPNSLPNAGSHDRFYFSALEPWSLERARRRLRQHR